MKLSRAGVVAYLEAHNLGLDSSERFDVRIPANEWAGILQSILTAEPPAMECIGDYERDTRPAGACKVLLLMPCATGRLETELTMPAPPAAKMQIGRAGSVLVEHVRYAPAESLYVCRCCFVRCAETENITTREGVEKIIKADTGLDWEHCETT